MGVVLLDSVAVIAYLDSANVFHSSAIGLITPASQTDDLIASAVTYAEVLVGAENGKADRAPIDTFFSAAIRRIEPVDKAVAERAAVIRAQLGLKMPDALILATADLHADRLITGDGKWSTANTSCNVEMLVTTGV